MEIRTCKNKDNHTLEIARDHNIVMDIASKDSKSKIEEEDRDVKVQVWKYILGFVEMAVVKCAIELKIADAIETHGSPMTLSQLSSLLNCSPLPLRRILRFLVHREIFQEETTTTDGITRYAQTPMSRLLASSGENSLAPLLLLESSQVMLAPWHRLSEFVKENDTPPFEMAHGKDLWNYTQANPSHNMLFNEAMARFARVVILPAVLESCRDIFEGIESLVDVGGGNGTSLSILVKSCPWIKGINFDLPHVVSVSQEHNGVQHIGGNMFHSIPKADAAFIMEVLHDWDDEECIKILQNCKEAIEEKRGKVIIVEVVIDEIKEEISKNKKLSDIRLMMDMVMMAHTNKGKERNREEWTNLLQMAGFTRFTITSTPTIQSVIQAFP